MAGVMGFILLIVIKQSRRPQIPEREVTPEAGAPEVSGPPSAPVGPQPKRDIRSLLAKTQEAFTAKLDALLLNTKQIDARFVDSLEELLYTGDLGPKTVEKL